jgi:hypothetical protein
MAVLKYEITPNIAGDDYTLEVRNHEGTISWNESGLSVAEAMVKVILMECLETPVTRTKHLH